MSVEAEEYRTQGFNPKAKGTMSDKTIRILCNEIAQAHKI